MHKVLAPTLAWFAHGWRGMLLNHTSILNLGDVVVFHIAATFDQSTTPPHPNNGVLRAKLS